MSSLEVVEALPEHLFSKDQIEDMMREYMHSAMPAIENAPKGSATVPSVFMGGASNATKRFTIADDILISYANQTTALKATATDACFPRWGAWCEDHFEGWWWVKLASDGKIYNVGYWEYYPLTDQFNQNASVTDGGTKQMGAYNPVDKKIYSLNGAALSVGTPLVGGYEAKGNITGLDENSTVKSMAINQEGKMYVIAMDATNPAALYEVNTTTLAATKIGSTGIKTGNYDQSAAFDARTGNLYWSAIDVTKLVYMMGKVNTTTGETIGIDCRYYFNALCMAPIYYTDKNPAAVTDLGLSYTSTPSAQVKATFTLPEVDVNGDALTSLDSVEIVKVELSGEKVVWCATQNLTPGQKMEATIDAIGWSGTVPLFLRTKKNHVSSLWSSAKVFCFQAPMPYANGFEDSDADLTTGTISFSPSNATVWERSDAVKRTGSYSCKITSGYLAETEADENENILIVQGIPVRKGATYTIKFYAKPESAEGCDGYYWINPTLNANGIVTASSSRGYLEFYPEGDAWEEITLTYLAQFTGQISLGLAGCGDVYYIDDLEIKETLSPDRPTKMVINSVTAVADGSNKAIINVTLPSKTLGGDNLTAPLSKIDFYAVLKSFTGKEQPIAEFTDGLTPGETKDFEVTMPEIGSYLLRGLTYNNAGSCPAWSEFLTPDGKYLERTPWIGYDTMCSNTYLDITMTATPQTDGKSKLEWSKPIGKHGGYIGTITYTVKEGDTKLYEGADTTCVTPALSTGMHTLSMSFDNGRDWRADNQKTQKLPVFGGLNADMMYCNIGRGSTGYFLNVSTSAQNSALSQVMYPKTDKAIYIDNLMIFTDAPDEEPATAAEETIKVYMGTTDKEEFDAFVEKDQLTLVYDGKLTFGVGKHEHSLPLKGFYYDGKKNLVISIVKPNQAKCTYLAYAYMGSETPTKYYNIYKTSTTINFDESESYAAIAAPSKGKRSMAMIASPMAAANLRTLALTVKYVDGEVNGVVPGATVTLTKDAEKEGKNLNARITTGTEGTVSFAYMPMGNFKVKVQKPGFVAQTVDLEITESTPATKELTVTLSRAARISVTGTVTDKNDQKLADVKVKADDGFGSVQEATTNAEGVFTIEDVYSLSDYTFTFEKAYMQTLTKNLTLEENNMTVAEAFKMAYATIPVPTATASVNAEGAAVVTWTQPAVVATATWKTPVITRSTRFTGDNKKALKYAQRFMPADLEAMKLGNNPKAMRFGFMPGSTTANYSIVIANDTNSTPLYRATVPAEKLVVGQWCDLDIATDVAIDITKQLWLIVEVAADATGNQNYPITVDIATGTNPYAGKGNLMWLDGKWAQMTAYNTGVTGNAYIRALLQDPTSKKDANNGYRIYRGKVEDTLKNYTLLTESENATGTTYTDAAYKDLPFGVYNYVIRADYYGDDTSKPTYTNVLNKDMEFTVTFNITSNAGAGKSKDAEIYLIDTGFNREYMATAGADGKATVAKKVWRDKYIYEVSLPYHQTVLDTLYLTQDTTLNVTINENIANPDIATATVEGKNVLITYGVNLHNWMDDVESYKDFVIDSLSFKPWMINSGVARGGVQGCTWTNSTAAQSWIVMNPSKTSPALGWTAYSGSKYFLALYPSANRYDLLVRPVTKGGGEFSFMSRVPSSTYKEAFAVVYSNTTADSAAFKPVSGGSISAFNSTTWTSFSAKIPDDAKYVGVRYFANKDNFGLLLDDLNYMADAPAKPVKYELYLDGAKLTEATETSFTFEGLDFGDHTLGVKAIYASGASEMVTKTVTIVKEATPIRLVAGVDELSAVLTWDMPEGFTPTSYKVFLGEELKGENITEKTYTLSGLKAGNYTASVLAVYETGESQKVSVDFTINKLADPINVMVKVVNQNAILSWKMPEGAKPQSYKVFLGDELKAEGLTTLVYTFEGLAAGNYTAGVVAVYKTGESEKMTKDFKIEVTGVEDAMSAVRAMVYPNPNNGLFYLQTNGAGMAEVYSLSGRLMVRKTIAAEGIYEIDLQNRAKGTYVLRFIGKNNAASIVKLIVR